METTVPSTITSERDHSACLMRGVVPIWRWDRLIRNQADGIHYTGEGYRLVVEKVFPTLEPLPERNR